MFPFILFLRKLRQKLKDIFYGTIVSTVVVILYGTFSEYYIENPISNSGIHSLFESFWWVIQTITTVGYGDVAIVSFWGKLNAIVVMLVGIGALGAFTASLAANMVDANIAARLGERRINMKDHIIVCSADEGIADIVSEFNENAFEVVLLDNEDPKPVKGTYSFVRGKCSVEDDLKKAGIDKASKILIFPERGISDASSADAKSILTAMVIKKLKSDSYVVLELLKEENRTHAVMAGADEVVVKGSISTLLMTSAVTSPGVSKLFYELLRGKDGYRIKEYSVEDEFDGKTCSEMYREMDIEGRVVLGFRSGDVIKIRPAGQSIVTWESVIVMEPRSG